MSKFIVKTTNLTALILSNAHSTFESSIQALPLNDYQRHLILKDDPLSTQHVLVQQQNSQGRQYRIEKKDIQIANTNRFELYYLLATVLNTVKSA